MPWLEASAALVRIDTWTTARATVDRAVLVERIQRFGVRNPRPAQELTVGSGGSRTGLIIDGRGLILTAASPELEANFDWDSSLRRSAAYAFVASAVDEQILATLRRNEAFPDFLEEVSEEVTLLDPEKTARVVLSNGEQVRFEVVENQTKAALLRVDGGDLPALARTSLSPSSRVVVAFEPTVDPTPGLWSLNDRGLVLEVMSPEEAVSRGRPGAPILDPTGALTGIITEGGVERGEALALTAKFGNDETGELTALIRRAAVAAAEGDRREAETLLREASSRFPGSPAIIQALAGLAPAPARVTPWLVAAAVLAALFTGGWGLRRRAIPDIEVEIGEVRDVHPFVYPSRTISEGETTELGELTVFEGDAAGIQFRLRGPGIRVGRDRRICEIILDDPRISRVHAELQVRGGVVILVDNESSNGTWVNGKRIERASLREGDIIRFGGPAAVGALYSRGDRG